jgi:hypothetical protein
MTDLQISLLAIGGTILVGVMSYNKWQEYKTRKTVERAFSSTHDDVLMKKDAPAPHVASNEAARIEPGFTSASADVVAGESPELELDPAVVSSQFIETAPNPDLPVDPLVDCIIPLELGAPVRGEKILANSQELRHVGNKPVHFIGFNENGRWEVIGHGAVYTAVQAGVQLATRQSALNEIEYSELITRLSQMAEELDAELDIPDMATVMLSARELHQFIGECYAQLSVNVQARSEPWNVVTLLAALRRQGFDVRPDGRLVMNVNQAAETTGLMTLLLEVPCVPPSRDGFGAMVACARMLATRLDGSVVDDGGQPLSDEALAEIAAQVASFYEHMEASDVPAGSARALRLFA